MTLEFSRLTAQVTALAQAAVAENSNLHEKQCQALEWLHSAAHDAAAVRARALAARELELDWHGACPPEPPWLDALDSGVDCPALVEPVTLIAADGSQIHPDQHAAALYYLINVGSIVLRLGSGLPPRVLTQPALHYAYDELHDEQGNLIAASLVDARRDLAELGTLEALTRQATPPIVAIRDGSLLWGHLEATPAARRRQQENLDRFLALLNQLRAHGAAVAGYVDRTLRFDVSRMLSLSRLGAEQLTRERLAPEADPLRGLNDERIFSFLAPGQRSARFILQSHTNQTYAEYGRERELEIWFFYLNVSLRPALPEVVRVEVPAWVARDEVALNRIHAVLVQQSHILEGAPYPYVLARADELAVVGAEEKEHLEALIMRELMQRDQRVASSRKARAKEHARGGRRRHQV